MPISVTETRLTGVLEIEPKVFGDDRGFFLETYSSRTYAEAGITDAFVQDNASSSKKGVLRGLHLQHPGAQGKLVWVLSGVVFDVAVDVRVGSPNFGKWVGVELDHQRKNQLWIPPGFAHGFCVLSEEAIFVYKCTTHYAPSHELSIKYNDPKINIAWPVASPVVSSKDEQGLLLDDVLANSPERLPAYP